LEDDSGVGADLEVLYCVIVAVTPCGARQGCLRCATRPQLRIKRGFSQDVGLSANHVEKVRADDLLVYVMSIDGSTSEIGPMRNFPE
jgi:hypothetical protein